MAFAAASSNTDTMSDINITPLVDVMLVLLVIFMVTAPMLDFRNSLRLPHGVPPERVVEPETLQLQVDPGDLFRLEGEAMTPVALQARLAQWRQAQPDGVLKLEVNADADYQSAATAMAVARRAGIDNIGLVEP
ncbi:ExbD/TolR family protein [Arenimonas sp. MALMAid1274]|uniref:ExbD/TolR family protein n=1 Tax=Arenimonas sp. MALMAid1274 TaxID=3411630 RepID=UPI003BA11E03